VLFCVLCLLVVPLPPGTNPFAVKINNNKIIRRRYRTTTQHCVISQKVAGVNVPYSTDDMYMLRQRVSYHSGIAVESQSYRG
jgi:hypothetical protein